MAAHTLLSPNRMTARDTARGIGIRALILLVGVVLVGIWLLSLALKIAGAAIHLLLWIGLILIAAGVVTVVMHRFRRGG
jgi:high-affinity Fe2+/Pb2+ permease